MRVKDVFQYGMGGMAKLSDVWDGYVFPSRIAHVGVPTTATTREKGSVKPAI